MYLHNDMIDLGFPVGQEVSWPSPAHKLVAIAACIYNERVTSRDVLIQNVKIINGLSEEKVRNVFVDELVEMGCTI